MPLYTRSKVMPQIEYRLPTFVTSPWFPPGLSNAQVSAGFRPTAPFAPPGGSEADEMSQLAIVFLPVAGFFASGAWYLPLGARTFAYFSLRELASARST